jgi:hypothetical protein
MNPVSDKISFKPLDSKYYKAKHHPNRARLNRNQWIHQDFRLMNIETQKNIFDFTNEYIESGVESMIVAGSKYIDRFPMFLSLNIWCIVGRHKLNLRADSPLNLITKVNRRLKSLK